MFSTTHWSVVLAAGHPHSPQSSQALDTLCRTYWYPVYVFVRRQGYNAEDAQDLTQAFFTRLLEKDFLATARPERGRFRWFLLASLRHFLANEWNRTRAAKRGGGVRFMPLDQLDAEGRFRTELAAGLDAEKLYERSWALAVLEAVQERLRDEFRAAGKSDHFELLMELLPGGRTDLTYAAAGRQCGLAESALKSEVHRFKRRYLAALRAEIAHTVTSPEEINEELHALMKAVSN